MEIDRTKISHLSPRNENLLVYTLAVTHGVPAMKIYENLERSGASYIGSRIAPNSQVEVMGIGLGSECAKHTGLYMDHFRKEIEERKMDLKDTDVVLYPIEGRGFFDQDELNELEKVLRGASIFIPFSITGIGFADKSISDQEIYVNRHLANVHERLSLENYDSASPLIKRSTRRFITEGGYSSRRLHFVPAYIEGRKHIRD